MITIDWSINLTGILSFGLAVGAGIAGWVQLRMNVAQLRIDLTEQQEIIDHYRAEMSTSLGTIHGKLEFNHKLVMEQLTTNARDVADFKLDVAKNYAGNTALEKVEARVVEAIKDLGKRVDAGARSRG